MTETQPTTVEIAPRHAARASVIWMHGLGADAHDFEPIVAELELPDTLGIRFVFPNATVRPITINGGMRMRAWYDILTMDVPRREDPEGVCDSERMITALIRQEKIRGVPANRIVLAGFSQGGAMALHTGLRYPERLAGIMALSCYIPLADRLSAERHAANQQTPIFIAHGNGDAVIPRHYGHMSVERLEKLGYHPEWHDYPMSHEVCPEEIKDIAHWLTHVLKD